MKKYIIIMLTMSLFFVGCNFSKPIINEEKAENINMEVKTSDINFFVVDYDNLCWEYPAEAYNGDFADWLYIIIDDNNAIKIEGSETCKTIINGIQNEDKTYSLEYDTSKKIETYNYNNIDMAVYKLNNFSIVE